MGEFFQIEGPDPERDMSLSKDESPIIEDKPPVLSRRKLLKDITTALALTLTGDRFVKTGEDITREAESENGFIKIPDFILEKPKTERPDLVPENITELIDEAWVALESQQAGFEIQTIKVPKKVSSAEKMKGKNKKAQGGKRNRNQKKAPVKTQNEEVVEKMVTNTLLATIDLRKKDEDEIHFVKINPQGLPEDESHHVEVGANLGVGTEYDVTLPEDHVVLAIKRAIKLDDGYEEVIYTPYSPELDSPVLRKAGFEYLINLLASARKELASDGVASLAEPGKPIAKGVPPDLALKLVISEQVDPFVFKARSQKLAQQKGISSATADVLVMKDMANQALTTVGANREWARMYAKSKPGARGLFQLMPKTYESLVGDQEGQKTKKPKLYPKAKINPDFKEGAAEHVNAAKAALLLFDSDFHDALAKHTVTDLSQQRKDELKLKPEVLGMYLAACYNTGSGNVRSAMIKYGGNWPQHVAPEARDYIRKFVALEGLFSGKVIEAKTVEPENEFKKLTPRNPERMRRHEDIPDKLKGSPDSMARQHAAASRQKLVYIQDREEMEKLTKSQNGKPSYLVPLPENDFLKIDPSLPEWRRYCRPETASFLLKFGEAMHKENPNFDPLMVTSAVRPETVQAALRGDTKGAKKGNKKAVKKNPNAAVNSTHPTGAVVDVVYNAVDKIDYEKDSAGNIIFKKQGKKFMPVIKSKTRVYNGITSQEQLEAMEKYLVDREPSEGEFTEETVEPCFHLMPFEKK